MAAKLQVRKNKSTPELTQKQHYPSPRPPTKSEDQATIRVIDFQLKQSITIRLFPLKRPTEIGQRPDRKQISADKGLHTSKRSDPARCL